MRRRPRRPPSSKVSARRTVLTVAWRQRARLPVCCFPSAYRALSPNGRLMPACGCRRGHRSEARRRARAPLLSSRGPWTSSISSTRGVAWPSPRLLRCEAHRARPGRPVSGEPSRQESAHPARAGGPCRRPCGAGRSPGRPSRRNSFGYLPRRLVSPGCCWVTVGMTTCSFEVSGPGDGQSPGICPAEGCSYKVWRFCASENSDRSVRCSGPHPTGLPRRTTAQDPQ